MRRVVQVVLVVVVAAIDLIVWSSYPPSDRTVARTGDRLPDWIVPAAVVLCYPVLLLRVVRPVLTFAAVAAFTVLLCLSIPTFQPFAALLLAMFSLTRQADRATATMALATTIAISWWNSLQPTIALGRQPRNLLALFLVWAAVAVTVWGFARILLAVERRGEQLRASESARAVQGERIRLARELHDVVAHSVSAMLMQAAGARALAPTEATGTREALKSIESTGVQAMRELHQLLHLLRSDESGGASAGRRLADLAALAEGVRGSGLQVELTTRGELTGLGVAVEHAAYRVVQEALTNSLKYAGPGARCDVTVDRRPGRLALEVRDHLNGARRTKDRSLSGELGLVGLRERVEALGGTIGWELLTDGFVLAAEIPLTE